MRQKSLAVFLACLFCVNSFVDFAWCANYAILIGINMYPDIEENLSGYERISLKNLKYCIDDMTGLKAALVKSRYANNEKNIVLLTTRGQTTSENILKVLNGYKGKLGANDNILVAFAGHGISLASKYSPELKDDYFCCSNAQIKYNRNSNEFDNEGLISLTEMNKILEGFKCSSKIFFTDACRSIVDQESFGRSGEILTGEVTKSVTNTSLIRGGLPNMTKVPKNIRGFHRIASCSIDEVSHEMPTFKHGVFTNFLIKGLEGAADENGDGRITLRELFDFASEMTTHTVYTHISKDLSQTPTYSTKEATGNFVVGHCTPKTPQSTGQGTQQGNTQQPQNNQQLYNPPRGGSAPGGGRG